MQKILTTAFLLAALGVSPAGADDADILDKLEGKWRAVGEVQGEKLEYRAEGRMVLMGGFLRLTLLDEAKSPQYEAAIYIGKSKKKGDFVAHWLDSFGADGAQVVGFGKSEGRALDLEFEYGDSIFKDRFEFADDGKSFTLVIDDCPKAGECGRFADFVFARR